MADIVERLRKDYELSGYAQSDPIVAIYEAERKEAAAEIAWLRLEHDSQVQDKGYLARENAKLRAVLEAIVDADPLRRFAKPYGDNDEG